MSNYAHNIAQPEAEYDRGTKSDPSGPFCLNLKLPTEGTGVMEV
jgi:hypothetical protein